jgi:YVTN family beta-propeller protein
MYMTRFGFGRRSSPDFPGESSGIVWDPAKLTDSALASVSMGYQVGVTPLQMAAAVSAIANEGELAVTVLEVESGQVVAKLEAGTEPETAVMSPDGKWVTVSNETSNDIYVIDTAALTVVKKIPVPKNPRGMRFTPDSRRLLVTSEKEHVISVIDVPGWTILKSAPTGGERPVDIVITADGRRAYVSHGKSGDVRVLDAHSLELQATIPVGPRAWWMGLTPDETLLYVAVGRAGEVVAIDTRSNTVAHRIRAGTLPWGIAIANLP